MSDFTVEMLDLTMIVATAFTPCSLPDAQQQDLTWSEQRGNMMTSQPIQLDGGKNWVNNNIVKFYVKQKGVNLMFGSYLRYSQHFILF